MTRPSFAALAIVTTACVGMTAAVYFHARGDGRSLALPLVACVQALIGVRAVLALMLGWGMGRERWGGPLRRGLIVATIPLVLALANVATWDWKLPPQRWTSCSSTL